MSGIRVAINGFGRIGRVLYRVLHGRKNIEVVGVNDLTSSSTLAHLLKYDSIHRRFPGEVSSEEQYLVVDGKKIRVFAEKDPAKLPWSELNVDIVIESTGHFLNEEGAALHLKAGAKRVIISAPAKEGKVKTVVLGVNDETLSPEDRIISNASCTTNNVAPLIKVLDSLWGIESGYITTIHSYTSDQNLQDGPHKDLRRARAAATSIIPTTTGAAKAVTDVFPELKGKLGGAGIRVPVHDGSLTDLTCLLKKPATINELNSAFKKASETNLKGIIQYTEDPIVSVDVIGSPYSCIFDAELTSALGTMVKVVGWYDNEMGYSNRLADLIEKVGSWS
jgi:glyceraldehyde 3-phosphate dehydrogenase